MRSFIVQLAQNLGNGVLGATLNISTRCVEVGPWSFETEKELTRITPSEVTVRIADVEGEIWSWIQTQIQSAGGLLPPWLTVDVDGVREFTGIISPSEMAHTPKTREINLTVADWSSMLGKKTLGAENADDDLTPGLNPWLRSFPLAASGHVVGETKTARLWYQNSTWQYYLMDFNTFIDYVGFPGQVNNWLKLGDLVISNRLPGEVFKVIGLYGWDVDYNGNPIPNGTNGYLVKLSPPGFTEKYKIATGAPHKWENTFHPSWEFELSRLPRETEYKSYYTVKKAVGHDDKNKCYTLELDTVDGIVPGDGLQLISNAKAPSWTVVQVDASAVAVLTREEIQDINLDDRVFFTKDSLLDLPMEDARTVLSRAVAPEFGVNLSRLQMPILPKPVLVWLPLRMAEGADLIPVRNVLADIASLQVYGSGLVVWTGTPEQGWIPSEYSQPSADWTSQLVDPPASLMPDETSTLTPDQPPSFLSIDLRWRSWPQLVLENGKWHWSIPSAWNPAAAAAPAALLLHDYLQMRRIKITGTAVVINAWTGTAWGSNSTCTWPAESVLSFNVFPGHPGEVLALVAGGLRAVSLPSGAQSMLRSIPDEAKDGRVITTAWGAYLVGSKGYGLVEYTGPGQLSINWVRLIPEDGGTLFPQTFAALDATTIVVLARLDTLDQDGKTVTETHLLRIPGEPGMPLASEKVLEGAPITLGALRDPSQTGRVIGHCGGRLFQVSKQLPAAYALERFKPTGMTAGELIEHVCQVLHAVAVPDATGTLHIVSRTLTETPIELAVSQMNVNETRAWEHFYSYVRVSGSDSEIYADVPEAGETTTLGGGLLEISGQPLIWTQSGCEAMARALHTWFSTPRRVQTQTWVWWDVDSAAPWESLPPLARVKINHLPTVWLVLALEDDKVRGTANVTLLEVG